MANRFVNPVPQFTDSAGNPLLDAELNFYTDETLTTRKDTFADANETIVNPNPLPLDGDGRTPNVFYDGTATVQLTNDEGSGQQQVWRADGVGAFGSGSAFDIWNPVTEYEDGALVEGSDGEYYRSLQDNNTGNDPISSPTFWEQVSFLRTWNPNITYAVGDGGVVGSDGKIYASLQAANLNNDPTSSPAFWAVNNPFDQDLNTTDSAVFAEVDAIIGANTPAASNFTTVDATGNISTGDGTIAPSASVDNIAITSAGAAAGITIGTSTVGTAVIAFADTVSPTAAQINFDQSVKIMRFKVAAADQFTLNATTADFQNNDITTTGALSKGSGTWLFEHVSQKQ